MDLNEYDLVFCQRKDDEYCRRNIPSKYYVYALKIGGKLYIGSSIHVIARIRQHVYEMSNGTHYNEYMNQAFSDCEEVFGYILDSADNKLDILKKEQYYIDKYDPYLNLGTANSKKGNYVYSLRSRVVLPKKRPVNCPIDKGNYKKMLDIKSQHRIALRELSYAAIVHFLNSFYHNENLSEEGIKKIEDILSNVNLDNF